MRIASETLAPIMADADERAAVAELMAPDENRFGRPSFEVSAPSCILILPLSPGEPVDDPDDDEE